MTSNIEAIRAAEAQLPLLQDQLRTLRQEALADDGMVDAEEQAEIDRVEGKIEEVRTVITDRRQYWETNKATYEQLRASLEPGLAAVARRCHQQRAHGLARGPAARIGGVLHH